MIGMEILALLHRIWGLTGVAAFLATGVYLNLHLPPPEVSNHLTRMLFRSAHVYLLLSGLINLALGTYLRIATSPLARRSQAVGSLLILVGPILVMTAFVYEPPRASLERPLTVFAIISLLAGTLLHFLSGVRSRRSSAVTKA